MTINFDEPVKIDLKKLRHYIGPFKYNYWVKCDSPIKRGEIKECLKRHELQSPDIPVEKEFDFWDVSSKEIHLKRIAWLVKNFNEEHPISLDFGIPSMGGSFCVDDGYHRLLAAYYKVIPYIKANCSGAITEIENYLYKC